MTGRRYRAKVRRPQSTDDVLDVSFEIGSLAEVLESHHETGPRLTGGDLDADWLGAAMSGEEAVGGSVQTPDQDIVDELARALGVEEGLDAPVRSLAETLEERDRRRWAFEEEAAAEEAGRGEP